MIIFRTDAGPDIGFGHLTRCRALAQALRAEGQECMMVGPDAAYAKAEDEETFKDWVPIGEWGSSVDDAARLIEIAEKVSADWLVIDDYRVDEPYQLALREANLHWLQFDGRPEKPLWADLVLNANPAATPEAYIQVLRNPDTQLLLGPRYAVLRPEFERICFRRSGREVRRILITFGGGDDHGATLTVASILMPLIHNAQQLVVISGGTNPSNGNLKEWATESGEGRVSLHIDPSGVAEIMSSCDLAILAGGTTTYEAAYCGLPMILTPIARNQLPQVDAWERAGAAINLGPFSQLSRQKLESAFQSLTHDQVRREEMREAGQRVSESGASLVAKQISKLIPCLSA